MLADKGSEVSPKHQHAQNSYTLQQNIIRAFSKAPSVQQTLAVQPQSAADVEELYYSLHLDLT